MHLHQEEKNISPQSKAGKRFLTRRTERIKLHLTRKDQTTSHAKTRRREEKPGSGKILELLSPRRTRRTRRIDYIAREDAKTRRRALRTGLTEKVGRGGNGRKWHDLAGIQDFFRVPKGAERIIRTRRREERKKKRQKRPGGLRLASIQASRLRVQYHFLFWFLYFASSRLRVFASSRAISSDLDLELVLF